MAGPLIEFVCVNPAHRPLHDGRHASTVTVHLGGWAYCDSAIESGHDWVDSGAIPLELLRTHPTGAPVAHSA